MSSFRLLSAPQTQRPLSQTAQGWKSKYHPLLSSNGQNLIRSQFDIGDWLVIGCCLQAVIVLSCPWGTLWSLAPTFVIAIWKICRTLMIITGWLENKHMKGVVVGKTTAIFPETDGSFSRKIGDSVSGKGVVVMMLTSKCNQ
jgi:hypothetical protein